MLKPNSFRGVDDLITTLYGFSPMFSICISAYLSFLAKTWKNLGVFEGVSKT